MKVTSVELGDVWEGKDCPLSKDIVDYFLIIDTTIKTVPKAKRFSDEEIVHPIGEIFQLNNWRLIKRNNKTICKLCI
jgi:hypothetical protein